jgi:urease accessory protein
MALKASVHIDTALQNGKTLLKKSFCHSPFKIADVTEDKCSKELKLMLMSSSPGVLDGDEYDFEINVDAHCSLQIETQAYQRIFQMKHGAKQAMNIYLGEGSSFKYLPHPLVPHQSSIFNSKNKIHLSEGCSLLWGEVISCGRKLNDEVFMFSSYHSVTEIYRHQKLMVKENLLLKPMQTNVQRMGQLEGFTHQATLIYINETIAVNDLINEAREQLKLCEGIEFGITELPVKGIIVRLLGYKAEQLFSLLKQIASLIEAMKAVEREKAKVHVV